MNVQKFQNDPVTQTAWIPNAEVREEFANSIEEDWSALVVIIEKSEELLRCTLEENEEQVANIIELAHQNTTSIIKYNDENA